MVGNESAPQAGKPCGACSSYNAPARTRTWDIRLRRPMLYPAELQALVRRSKQHRKATDGSESAQRAKRPFSSNILRCCWLVRPSPDRHSHTPSGRRIHARGPGSRRERAVVESTFSCPFPWGQYRPPLSSERPGPRKISRGCSRRSTRRKSARAAAPNRPRRARAPFG